MPTVPQYQITISPTIGGETQDKLIQVEFAAHRPDTGDKRSWQTDETGLLRLFEVVKDVHIASGAVADLYEGKQVVLPGLYSAVDSLMLGFRVYPHKGKTRSLRSTG